MDALIMDGRDLSMGAIAAIQRVRHPISLARRVMAESGHNFLVGLGADAFADIAHATWAKAGVVPEVELYDVGHLDITLGLLQKQLIKNPLHVQFVRGVRGFAAR